MTHSLIVPESVVPSSPTTPPALPIDEVIPVIRQRLAAHHALILEAPPGAGKTTRVPLALLHEPWLNGRKILLLEPRRIAARAAAGYMADALGETVGETVGFRVRQETRIGPRTRIEVVTEGVLNRLLLDDPALDDVALIMFDEFHERSLEADSGLALALQGRELFRDAGQPLRILVMSATLNGAALTRLFDDAPVVRSEGRQYPVTVHYAKPWRYNDDIVARTVTATVQALEAHSGNLLVFLPGQREIHRAREQLRERIGTDTRLLPLYGALSREEQQQAIAPAPGGQRKVVLATDIAETSLTIEGIVVVIDSGLARAPAFDPNSGMTRLQTVRISQDSATQRAGRAGRLQAGHCYRLWSEEQQGQLAAFRPPEIAQADLAPLMLQLLAWGVDDPDELPWLDAPPAGARAQALDLLHDLGAIRQRPVPDRGSLAQWQLTERGEAMARLPAHPRLAHMLLAGSQHGRTETACALAALLSERLPAAAGADLSPMVVQLTDGNPQPRDRTGWLQRTRRQAQQFHKALNRVAGERDTGTDSRSWSADRATGFLLACAYPDRIARRHDPATGTYQLSNGQMATLAQDEVLNREPWLVVAELAGQQRADRTRQRHRILTACAFDPTLFDDALLDRVTDTEIMEWDDGRARFVAEHRRSVGKLVLSTQPLHNPPAAIRTQAVLDLIRQRELEPLPWDQSARQWQARVQLLHRLRASHDIDGDWPDVSDRALAQNLEQWLAPFVQQVTTLADLAQLDLRAILSGLLPWPLTQQLDTLCPPTITVPSGSNLRIDYREDPPVLRVKLQEMFGCSDTPAIVDGQVKLMLHLLSPAQRPLQVTRDLAGFWQTTYFDVKKDMRGRYPKHPWPDDPLAATATRHTKKRSTS